MVPTGSKRAVLGTLKPMHFSFVTKLMIFGKFDHLHLPQPQGRHGKVHQAVRWLVKSLKKNDKGDKQ